LILIESVPVPRLGTQHDLAPHPARETEAIGLGPHVARTEFFETPPDAVDREDAVAIGVEKGAIEAEELAQRCRVKRIGVRIGDQDRARTLAKAGRADRFGRLLKGIGLLRVEELAISFDVGGELIFAERRELVALERPEQEIGGRVIELIGRAAEGQGLAVRAEADALDRAGTRAVRVAQVDPHDARELR
jgi:hypothetical protein